jgi:mannose-1-phosphate guanylyltransferase
MLKAMKTVILAAGFGSRLWPLSTSQKPKQFQPLLGGVSPLQNTYNMLSKLINTQDIYVLTLEGLQSHVFDQLPNCASDHVLCVPERRNTWPHTLWALTVLGDEPLLFKSVDHFVRAPEIFLNSLQKQLDVAHSDHVTLLCNDPEPFDSNDGYAVVDDAGHITAFVEKPSREQFDEFRAQGSVYRSPLLYIGSRGAFAAALKGIDADWARTSERLLAAKPADRAQAFLDLPVADISSTFFQAAAELWAQPIDYQFVDIGSFRTLHKLNDKDRDGNVVIGSVVLGEGCQGNFIVNHLSQPLVVQNTQGCVVVQTKDGSLVTPLATADAVGNLYKTRIHPHEA